MARSGWAAVVVTVVLVGILGTAAATERAADADDGVRPLVDSLTRFPAWNSESIVGNGDLLPAVAAKLTVVLVAIFLLAYFAGRTDSGPAAFLAGWGALVVACAVAGGAFYAVAELTAFEGELADSEGGTWAPLVHEMNAGAMFALYTGWVVASAVTVTRRPIPLAATVGAAGPSSAAGPAGEPSSGPGPGPGSGQGPGFGPAPHIPGMGSAPPRGPFSPPAAPRTPVATWPPMPAQVGTVAPSPAWAPPRTASPLPAVALQRDHTATGLPRRPTPAHRKNPRASASSSPPPPPHQNEDPTKVHPGPPAPSPDQDPTTAL